MKNKMKAIFMLMTIVLLISSTFMVSAISMKRTIDDSWEAEIWITESGGRHDYVIIGEKPDASDGVDVWYDVPKCPSPPSPYVRAYIYHAGLQYPYETLWFEYRNSTENVYKEWELCSMVNVFDPTEVTITWDKKDFRDSGYRSATLCDDTGIPLVNMKRSESYTYQSDAFSFNKFIIKTDPMFVHLSLSLRK